MPRHSQQDIKQRYDKLPNILKEAMFSPDIAEKMFAIGIKNALTIEQIGAVSEETGYIILGLTAPRGFIDILAKRLGVESEVAQTIAREINHDVLALLREALMTTHQTAMTEEDIAEATGMIPQSTPNQTEPLPRPASTMTVTPAPSARAPAPQLKFQRPAPPLPPQKTFAQIPGIPPRTSSPPAASDMPKSMPSSHISPSTAPKIFRQIPPPPPPPRSYNETPLSTQEKTFPLPTALKNPTPLTPKPPGVTLERVMPKQEPIQKISPPSLTAPPSLVPPRQSHVTPDETTPAPSLPQSAMPDTFVPPAPPLDPRSQRILPAKLPPSALIMDPRTSLDLRSLTRSPTGATALETPPLPKFSTPLQQTPSAAPHSNPTPGPIASIAQTHQSSPSATAPRPPQHSNPPTGSPNSASDPYREPVEE